MANSAVEIGDVFVRRRDLEVTPMGQRAPGWEATGVGRAGAWALQLGGVTRYEREGDLLNPAGEWVRAEGGTGRPLTIRALARLASNELAEYDVAQAEARRSMAVSALAAVDLARDTAERRLRAFGERLYAAGHLMRADEIGAMRERVLRGVVAGTWALRIVAVGEECAARDGEAL